MRRGVPHCLALRRPNDFLINEEVEKNYAPVTNINQKHSSKDITKGVNLGWTVVKLLELW